MDNNKKYFVVSDIHGFYTECILALQEAGFRKTNKNHILIVCGDIFDRGSECLEIYNFLKSLPQSRCILIRGNHEQLYLELLRKNYPEGHDFHNCTVDTFCQIADQYYFIDSPNDDERVKMSDFLDDGGYIYLDPDYGRQEKSSLWEDIRNKVANSEVTKWLQSSRWLNYYELDNFIFVHSFIPTSLKQSAINDFGMMAYGFENPDYYEYDPNWRSKDAGWNKAIWGCPFSQYQAQLFKPEEEKGKTLVCGHWHTSDFFRKLKHIHIYDHDCAPVYFSKGLVGIDGGCMYDPYYKEFIHPQNILVINEKGVCYDKHGKKLEEPNEEDYSEVFSLNIKEDKK